MLKCFNETLTMNIDNCLGYLKHMIINISDNVALIEMWILKRNNKAPAFDW